MPSDNRSNQAPPDRGREKRSGASFVDPLTLMRIRNLELRAKVVVEGFAGGLHRSPYHGFSVEFSEYRQYSPGDDPRYLDWKVYARSDRSYIKRYEDETNLRCHLLVDMSRSMGFGSLAYTKAEYAATAAATLGYFLSRQRDAVGLITFDDQIVDFLPARYRPGHLHRLILCLERPPSGKATSLTQPLEQIAGVVNKRGILVIISDFLAPLDALEQSLGYVRARGHEVILLRVLDPAEENFTFSDAAMFRDMESDRSIYIDPSVCRDEYLERLREHTAAVTRITNALGIDFFSMTTDRPLELTLFDFLNARLRRGRRVVRRTQRGRP